MKQLDGSQKAALIALQAALQEARECGLWNIILDFTAGWTSIHDVIDAVDELKAKVDSENANG